MHVVVVVCLVQYMETRKNTHIVVVGVVVVYQWESVVVADVVGVVREIVVVVVYCTSAGPRRVGLVFVQYKGVWCPLAVPLLWRLWLFLAWLWMV